MSDPGVDVRPLVQMTGDAEFNEVFLTDVFVPAEHVVGIEGQGWTVAGSTLAHERGTNFPFKEQVVHEAYLARLYEEARANGSLDDPLVADALAQAYIDLNVLRLHNLRTLTRLGRGEEPGPESSWVKLTWTTMTQGLSDAALLVTGRDRDRPPRRAPGHGSGSGARRPASPAGRHRCSATSSPGGSWACRVSGSPARGAPSAHARGARGRGVTCSMRGKELLSRRAASNLAAAKMDLAGATEDDDEDRITLLETLLSSGADILVYRPQLQHYALLFGDLETAEHVAVFVPGVGDGRTCARNGSPTRINLYEASDLDGRRPVEGLRQPGRRPGRGGGVHRVQRRPGDGGLRPHRVHRLAVARSPSSR